MSLGDLKADELLRLCIDSRDPEVWDEFVKRFHKIIAISIIRVANEYGSATVDLVEDLVQDTYTKLCLDNCRALRSFSSNHQEGIFAYLKVVAANLARDHFRSSRSGKRGGHEDHVPIDDGVPIPRPVDLEREVLLREIEQQLQQYTEGTNGERDRRVFWLYYRQGFTASAISALPGIGLTVKGVETLLLRLTRALRQQLAGMAETNEG